MITLVIFLLIMNITETFIFAWYVKYVEHESEGKEW